MNKKFFWIFFLIIIVFLLSVTFILSNVNDQNDEIINSNENYIVYDVSKGGKAIYKYKIYNRQGRVVKDEIVERIEPTIEYLDDNEILSIKISNGPGSYSTQYYDIKKDLFSEIFESPLIAEYSKVVCIYFLNNEFRLIIRDMFDESKYYKEFTLDFSPVANPTDAWRDIRFLDEKTLEITYLSGPKYDEKTVRLSLELS